ncbi:MAG: FHA domain-containing protein [Paramuribaculum sp.]|nr:FHA domain-containing protein [Paramuribaculum sp.]
MAKEIIIGRSGVSPIAVPPEKDQVNGSHVKITIGDDGSWTIQDLNSMHGTYIKDEDGDFQRVSKKAISENTIIRLGREGHNSFTFMAHRAIDPDGSYAYEFHELKKILAELMDEEEQLGATTSRNMTLVKCAPILGMLLSMAIPLFIPAIQKNPTANMNLTRFCMAGLPFLVGILIKTNTNAPKLLKQKRMKLLVCPRCNYPISDFDIQNKHCSRCKAH